MEPRVRALYGVGAILFSLVGLYIAMKIDQLLSRFGIGQPRKRE
jgi:hypothetical protein